MYQIRNADNSIGPDLADASDINPELDADRLRIMAQLVHKDGLSQFTGHQLVMGRVRHTATRAMSQATRELRTLIDELTAQRAELQARLRAASPEDRSSVDSLLCQVRVARDAIFQAHSVLRSSQSRPPQPDKTGENFAQFWLNSHASETKPLHLVWTWLLRPSQFGLVEDPPVSVRS